MKDYWHKLGHSISLLNAVIWQHGGDAERMRHGEKWAWIESHPAALRTYHYVCAHFTGHSVAHRYLTYPTMGPLSPSEEDNRHDLSVPARETWTVMQEISAGGDSAAPAPFQATAAQGRQERHCDDYDGLSTPELYADLRRRFDASKAPSDNAKYIVVCDAWNRDHPQSAKRVNEGHVRRALGKKK